MSAREAQRLADEKNLDLVKIAPTAAPPVCRFATSSRTARSTTVEEHIPCHKRGVYGKDRDNAG